METLTQTIYPEALPEFREAWELQLKIEHDEKQLELDKKRLNDMLTELQQKGTDKVFVVMGVRKIRNVNIDTFKQKHPDEYLELAYLQSKSVAKIMASKYSKEEIVRECAKVNPELTQKEMYVSVTDLEKLVGKEEMNSMIRDGSVNVLHKATEKTHLEVRQDYQMMMAPQLPSHNPYPVHDEGDDDE